MEPVATLHVSVAGVAHDLPAVRAKVRQGVEVAIEQDHRPAAVIKPSGPAGPGRKLSERIALEPAALESDRRANHLTPPPTG